ncbi:MAG TPA: chain length-determining protein, partial [Gammaproteobacteria bacterium]|nr:chain length-determining protein [Gammaproteobacteria bacterium]
MNEILGQIIDYIRGTWRYRWFMFLAAWPICIGGWVYVQTLPDQYTASARVYVDTSTMLRPLLSGLTVRSNVQSELSLMTRTLFSRPSLEKIARMTDLDLKAKTPEQMDSLLNGLAGKIKLSRTNRDSLYRISYQDSDPDLAKRLVQAVLTLFVEGALGESRKDSDTAQRFLDQQIEEYEARLVAAENRLKEFKRKNLGRMPKDGGSYYSSLQAAMGRLEQARLELREAQNRRDELARQIREGKFAAAPGGPVGGPGSLTPELDARILNLQKRLDELLLGYTEQHPDVILTRRTIEDLEKQRQKVLEGRQASAGDEGTRGASNLIKSQLQVALSEAEATVASLRVRVREYKGRVDELKRLVNVIPEVEVQLKQLNRDYNVTKSKYEELLVRREKAAMSEKLEQSPDAVKFRVVDPPY